MTPTAHAQVSHESETQRQYPRLALPCRALIGGKEFSVKNLSTGGIAFVGADSALVRGKQVAIDLKLPFQSFFLGMTLNAEVLYTNAAEKTIGCRFIHQTPDQISFLNHAVKSFVAGDIVSSGSILNIAARNNFTKARSHANSNANVSSLKRQLPGLFVVLVVGLLIAGLIGGNLYNNMFVVKASDAAVVGPIVAVRATTDGVFRSRLDPGLTLVQQNQVIGTVTPVGGGAAASFQSPCNCYIAKTHLVSGELASAGQEIVSLVPMDAKPWILAEMDPAQGRRIEPDSQAHVSVFGSRTEYTGRVVSMESALSDHSAGDRKGVRMKITLDQKLPVDFVNRLASVTFALR